jgi:hypothetical protein
MKRTGVGHIDDPGPIQTTEGKLTEQSAAALSSFVQQVVETLNGNLSLGDETKSSLAGNFSVQRIEHFFKTADAEEEIPHSLGRKPVGFWPVLKDEYADFKVSNFGGWGDGRLFLKSSASGVTATFLVW